jgi:hypothetical protein
VISASRPLGLALAVCGAIGCGSRAPPRQTGAAKPAPMAFDEWVQRAEMVAANPDVGSALGDPVRDLLRSANPSAVGPEHIKPAGEVASRALAALWSLGRWLAARGRFDDVVDVELARYRLASRAIEVEVEGARAARGVERNDRIRDLERSRAAAAVSLCALMFASARAGPAARGRARSALLDAETYQPLDRRALQLVVATIEINRYFWGKIERIKRIHALASRLRDSRPFAGDGARVRYQGLRRPASDAWRETASITGGFSVLAPPFALAKLTRTRMPSGQLRTAHSVEAVDTGVRYVASCVDGVSSVAMADAIRQRGARAVDAPAPGRWLEVGDGGDLVRYRIVDRPRGACALSVGGSTSAARGPEAERFFGSFRSRVGKSS